MIKGLDVIRRFFRKRKKTGLSYLIACTWLCCRFIIRMFIDPTAPQFGTLWGIVSVLGWPMWFADEGLLQEEITQIYMPDSLKQSHQLVGIFMIVVGQILRSMHDTAIIKAQQKRTDRALGVIDHIEKRVSIAIQQFQRYGYLAQDEILNILTGGNGYLYFIPKIENSQLILDPIFIGNHPLHDCKITSETKMIQAGVDISQKAHSYIETVKNGMILRDQEYFYPVIYGNNSHEHQRIYKLKSKVDSESFVWIKIVINSRNGSIRQDVVARWDQSNSYSLNFTVICIKNKRMINSDIDIVSTEKTPMQKIIKGIDEEKTAFQFKNCPDLTSIFQGKFRHNIRLDKGINQWTYTSNFAPQSTNPNQPQK